MIFQDSRFTTPNTNLASCLGALRIPLKNVTAEDGKVYADYVRIIEDADTGKRIIYWHFEDAGEEYNADAIQTYWTHRASFEAEQPDHPLIPMRKALEKLEWLTKVWHGNIKPSEIEGEAKTKTAGITFAACLMASGNDLLSFDARAKVFSFGLVKKSDAEAFDNYRNNPHPVAQMRLALEVRKLLLKELRRPDLKTEVRYTSGDPLNGGKVLHLIKGSSPSDIELLIGKLYE